MIDSQWFSMLGTPFTIGFSVVLVVVTALFSWITLKRSQFSRGMCFLESLRMLLVVLVAITINQPEWMQQYLPDEDPVLVVMGDVSASMKTQDVVDGLNPTAKPLRREERVDALLDEEVWASVADKVKVVKVPFSSGLPDSAQGTDLNGALNSAIEKHSNLRGVVVLSDGSWNVGGSPTKAATRLRMAGVPAFTIAVGSENALPDLEIAALDAPTFGVVNKPIRIPFTIASTMATRTPMVASLSSSGGGKVEKEIEVLANGRMRETLTWTPKKVGEYTLTLSIPETDGELMTDNNTLSVPISIRKESLKVLVVESFPRWEYRYLRNALDRDPGVEVTCLVFHPQLAKTGDGKGYIGAFPSELDELAKFDVIFLGDVGVGEGQLTVEDCRRIKGLVESQACGLILMPGFRGRQFSLLSTELSGLFPVHLDEAQPRGWGSQVAAQFQLTEAGQNSLLTKLADSAEANASVWRTLPGFQWFAPVTRAKAGALVLAVHAGESGSNTRTPLLVTKTYGSGKILFMGTDGAWRWRKGVEDKYHYRFWGQVIRWMAYQRNMAGGKNMRLFYSPDRPKVGQQLTLSANVMAISGEPLQKGNINVQVISPSGNSQQIQLVPPSGNTEWGLFTNTFTPQESGDHQVVMICRENGSTLETVINVQGEAREKTGKPTNVESMQEIADITRGQMVDSDQIDEILNAIADLPEPEPRIRRIRLWANPFWGGLIVLLLGLFWSGRKLIGKT